ncbi:MAG: NAD(P)/FAD-dependent oxidoreductase [Proteobacteria bacterium]|nr:NAD(P)/FAD-dependent oxidoreductase [Pseudomonadota bacterium]
MIHCNVNPQEKTPSNNILPTQRNPIPMIYDDVIVGAGISGALAFHTLTKYSPHSKVLIIDTLCGPGGRRCPPHPITSQTATSQNTTNWGNGLFLLPASTIAVIKNTLGAKQLSHITPIKTYGVITSQRLHRFCHNELFSHKTITAFSDRKTAKALDQLTTLLHDPITIALLEKKPTKKHIALSLHTLRQTYNNLIHHLSSPPHKGFLHTLMAFLGLLPQPTKEGLLPPHQIIAFIKQLCACLPQDQDENIAPFHSAQLNHICADIFHNTPCNPDIHFQETAMKAIQQDHNFSVTTCQNHYQSKRLICASNPWDLMRWFDLGSLTSKQHKRLIHATRPQPLSYISLVASGLSNTINDDLDHLPSLIFIPQEQTHILKSNSTLILNTLVSFETSVHAPGALKAIKRLRRAQKRLEEYLSPNKARCLKEKCVKVTPYARPSFTEGLGGTPTTQSTNLQANMFLCSQGFGPYFDEPTNLSFHLEQLANSLKYSYPSTSPITASFSL